MFGKRLRSLRESKKMSQKDLAKELKIPNQNISNYEREFRHPDFETLKLLASYFDVTVDYLLGFSNDQQKQIVSDRDKIINQISEEFPDADLMFKDMENLSAEQLKEVYEFIKFKKSQKNE